ncbi:MAG: hypothetical protein EOP51_06515 [Sphingobacteriales bacterium]|nr:MAG: hypothetical protein EOP51_06515 [Sphingobacteriales bacterium]
MIFDVLIVIVIIIWGVSGIKTVFQIPNKLDNNDIRFLRSAYFFHLGVSLLFSTYIMANGGDAIGYWFMGRFSLDKGWLQYFQPGTFFILFLTYPLVYFFNISFYVGGLIFAAIGFNGFIYFYLLLKKFHYHRLIYFGVNLVTLLFYLPNLHFWSSGIGKDALAFFAIMGFFYSLTNIRKKWFLLFFTLALSYFIRPHIALFLVSSTFLAVLIDGKMKMNVRIALILIVVVSFILLFNRVLTFLQLEDVSSTSVGQFSEGKLSKLSKNSGSSVDMSSYPLPIKMFTFLYRPLFFDANGFLGIIASLENLFILMLSYTAIRLRPLRAFRAAAMPIKAIALFTIISTIAFSFILSNLGIILRQKSPIIICLLTFIVWVYVKNQADRKAKKAAAIRAKQ